MPSRSRAPRKRRDSAPKVEIIAPGRLEPVEALRTPSDTFGPPAGHHETTAFQLYLRMHEAMIKALVCFAFCVGLVLPVKGGLPIQEAALKELKLNVVTNNKLFTGLVGLLAIFFAGLTGHWARVAANKPSGGGLRGTAVVAFGLTPSGAIAYFRLTRSSGTAALDQLALAAVRRSAPFPKPPAGATSAQLRIAIPFHFQ